MRAEVKHTPALVQVYMCRPDSSGVLIEILRGLPDFLPQPSSHNSAHGVRKSSPSTPVDIIPGRQVGRLGAGGVCLSEDVQGSLEAPQRGFSSGLCSPRGYQLGVGQPLRNASARVGVFAVATNWGPLGGASSPASGKLPNCPCFDPTWRLLGQNLWM